MILSDLIGRLRSGGAISLDEQKTYKKLIPAFGDDKKTQEYKLKRLDEIFNGLDSKIKGTQAPNSGGDPLGLFTK
jgi:RNA processing factor Prp31